MQKTPEQIRREYIDRELNNDLRGYTTLELIDVFCVISYLRIKHDRNIFKIKKWALACMLAPIGFVLYESIMFNNKGK